VNDYTSRAAYTSGNYMPTMALPKTGFGARLVHAIEREAGISQAEFARRMKASRQTVYRWTTMPRAPGDDTLLRMAEVLEVRPEWLRYGTGQPRTDEESPESAVYDPAEGGDERPGVGEEELVQMPQVVRFLKLHDGKPDERELKLATVRIWGEVLALNGAWPDWFLVLRGKVERGEI
jgi:transcriptional regulator with XRE-family HTH domain